MGTPAAAAASIESLFADRPVEVDVKPRVEGTFVPDQLHNCFGTLTGTEAVLLRWHREQRLDALHTEVARDNANGRRTR
jgi:hypothetical protein